MPGFFEKLDNYVKKLSSEYLERPIAFTKVQVGFDLGGHCLKFAITDDANHKVVNLWRAEMMPERETRRQELSDREVVTRLNEMSKKLKSKFPQMKKEVNTVIQGEWTSNQYLEFPLLSSEELKTAVRTKSLKGIPFDMDEIQLNYTRVPPLDGSPDKTAVFVSAARKSVLDRFSRQLGECGFMVDRIETVVLPLAREFAANRKPPIDEYHILVNVGHVLTNIVIVRGGFPYYAREISIGGREFTYAFQMSMQCSWQEAEEYKLDYDVLQRESPLEPFLLKWVGEIRKTIDFFKMQHPDIKPDFHRIYVSGGSANFKNLVLFIQDQLKIETALDVWDNVEFYGKPPAKPWVYKVVVGLTL